MVQGDGCDVDVLKAAGLDEADVVAAVTGDDEDNLVVSLLSKQEFGVPARRGPRQQPEERVDVQRDRGASTWPCRTPHLITGAGAGGGDASARSCGCCRSRAARPSWPRSRWPTARRRPTRRSPSSRFPRDATVVAVLRDDRLVVPRGDTILRVGDEVMVLVTDESEAAVRATVLVGA